MDTKSEEISELVLPEIKERKGYLVYLKIIFIPAVLFAFILLAYFHYINFEVQTHTVVMIGAIFFVALLFAKHSAEYSFSVFEQQKDEFKQALKRHIMKHFLTIGKDTKSNANFDEFADEFIKNTRNENFASIGAAIFPMMGILGTFISIAISMPNFNSSDTLALEQEIATLLSGVATAFYVSIYGIFLALWWMFFEKIGKSKIAKLLNRQKKSTLGFFWTKEELDQKYLKESLQHFEKIGMIFQHVNNTNFFAELDHTIERKFSLFQDMLNTEEKAIRLSSEHIKQTMNELSRAQRDQRDLGKLYSEMFNAVELLNQSVKEIGTRMSEQYNRLLNVGNEKIQHLDKTMTTFDQKVERFQKGFELYEKFMLESQERVFNGFRDSLFEGMHRFKEVYEEEKDIDAKINMMQNLKQEIRSLDSETSAMLSKIKTEQTSQASQKNNESENLKDTQNTQTETMQTSQAKENDEAKSDDTATQNLVNKEN